MPVIQVSKSRWEDAQEWELRYWQAQQGLYGKGFRRIIRRLKYMVWNVADKRHGDDWNHWWAEKFDNYIQIPKEMDHAIEIGCGPYTNMRIISNGRKILYKYCSDPLAYEYIKLLGWLSDAYRKGLIALDAHPAEDCPFKSNLFDLVVMINVLDHVRNAEDCVEQAIRITKPGGFFVLGQDLTEAEEAPNNFVAEIGHPIKLTHDLLSSLVIDRFDAILEKILPKEQARNPIVQSGTYCYIGMKKHT